ncbi:MAG: ACP S-malonyltransferase, partial [Synergistaceae bacterium]|nr:ACP S-malonyltransferase [Synergistaceae bacterium]
MPYALIFPGQGAQEVGMGRDFYDQYDIARDVFKEADEALGFSLTRLIFEGPEEDLMKTAITQPAVMTMSIAVMRVFEKEYGEKLNPLFVAGHSLGEYTALIAAEALPFAEGVSLVHKRGQWMQEAVPLGMGAMAAIMGLDMDTLKDVCEQAAEGEVCQPANVNAPTQIVISGHTAAVGRTMETAKAIGASKVIPLKVS